MYKLLKNRGNDIDETNLNFQNWHFGIQEKVKLIQGILNIYKFN